MKAAILLPAALANTLVSALLFGATAVSFAVLDQPQTSSAALDIWLITALASLRVVIVANVVAIAAASLATRTRSTPYLVAMIVAGVVAVGLVEHGPSPISAHMPLVTLALGLAVALPWAVGAKLAARTAAA